jgi:MoaA/NifB/PqqE/SkfB family radical SAM enzyme
MPVTSTAALTARVDSDGRLVLPSEVAGRLGLVPGASVTLDEEANSIRLRRPVEHLAKVYVEPTTRCNLTCRTCIRNAWEEPAGDMGPEVFERLLQDLAALDPSPGVVLGGFGEPLAHPRILEMVERVKALGVPRVELITNGCLLDQGTSRSLIEAGLDTLWVSLDGIRPESYNDVRLGALLPQVLENLRGFREIRSRLCDCSALPEPRHLPGWGLPREYMGHYMAMERYLVDLARRLSVRDAAAPAGSEPDHELSPSRLPCTELGIAFVAMKRNIADLPFVVWAGRMVGATRFNVSNVIPYTAEMVEEVLYEDSLQVAPMPTLWHEALKLPAIDVSDLTRTQLRAVVHGRHESTLLRSDVSRVTRSCPFVEAGSTSIAWDGKVGPCQELLHTHNEYVNRRRRCIDSYVVGDLSERSLADIWSDPDYVAFRRRVQGFDFAPCIACGGCAMSDGNQADCEDDTFPRCGACLWAHGVIRCP